MRRLAACLLVAVAGCSAAAAPDKTDRSWREEKLADVEQPSKERDYASQWRAAQLCYELADEDIEHREKSQRKEFAKRGLAHAEKAIKLQPELVEGHFYKMICLGRVLELASLPEAVLVADLRDEGERTARIDERFECAGAHRFLGIFYSEAPESGPYPYGDTDKAEKHFERALELIPDCPENLIAYAQFQLEKMENKDGARAMLQRALDSVDKHPNLTPEQRESYRAKAKKMLEDLK